MRYARSGLLILIAVVSILTWILVTEPRGDWQLLGPEKWPVTVEAVVDDVLPRLSLFDKLMIMSTKKERIFALHFDLGLPIRNRYGLWRGNDKLILAACGYPCHPDDASMPMIEGVWKALHNCLRCLLPKDPRKEND